MIKIIPILVLAACLKDALATVTIAIEPPVVEPGNTVKVRCHVMNMIPGEMVSWSKRQLENQEDTLGFNNIISHSSYQPRFKIEPSEEVGNNELYFNMIISDSKPEDTGEYGCGVFGKPETVAWGKLDVIVQPSSVQMYALESSDDDVSDSNPLSDGAMLHVEEGDVTYLRCDVIGANPEPEVMMTYASFDFNDKFDKTSNQYEEAPNGQLVNNRNLILHDVTMLSKNALKVKKSDNRQPLTCSVSVAGGEPIKVTVRPVLRVAPRATCTAVFAPLYAGNVTLTCNIEADPDPTSLAFHWKLLDNSTKLLKEGEEYDGIYSAHKKIIEDGTIDFSLVIKRAFSQTFQSYFVYVENELGRLEQNVTLFRDYVAEAKQGAGSTSVTLTLLISALLAALWRFV